MAIIIGYIICIVATIAGGFVLIEYFYSKELKPVFEIGDEPFHDKAEVEIIAVFMCLDYQYDESPPNVYLVRDVYGDEQYVSEEELTEILK